MQKSEALVLRLAPIYDQPTRYVFSKYLSGIPEVPHASIAATHRSRVCKVPDVGKRASAFEAYQHAPNCCKTYL